MAADVNVLDRTAKFAAEAVDKVFSRPIYSLILKYFVSPVKWEKDEVFAMNELLYCIAFTGFYFALGGLLVVASVKTVSWYESYQERSKARAAKLRAIRRRQRQMN